MNFGLSSEQEMLVETARTFVERELYPYEQEVEQTRAVRPDLVRQVIARALETGLYAANMPEDLGGGGLDTVSMCLVDRELGRASYALHYLVARPSNILQACVGDQRERYLFPAIRGEKVDCLAMTEPEAGSDVRSMRCTARQDGGDWVIDGEKHFISHADLADFVILFAASGEEDTPRGRKKRITSFLIDKGTPGFEVLPGYVSVSHRGYHNCRLRFENCRVPAGQLLGEPHRGFEVANDWLGATRLQVAATCLGRSHRALDLATEWAAQRRQFGQQIGKFQGIGFKLADMKTMLQQAELLTLWAAWRHDQKAMRDEDAAMAKLAASEALGRIADEALQIFGGMGLMEDLPLERIWRDARVERIWEGTSEIQRHIISRAMLRPLGA
ncbi:MAG TPA: acyl-CoA dehydrogenase family protein [Geminicoccus sp.]|jgi:alkylation response protein AidB-like acyl-CoA dehydrogenase|uniref:acyl-CoA dehydrogenase family protein n=1 Tax=Geminicoccus sp. TaxID=2024832 RepID=UPI002E33F7A0|nr:acyl-CoA dehydrogenase family protein [Geminicoccus sp.]HEX2526473.1 acyl-CoA dehydrogenase family protein [Geminicoccus sp.]